MSKKTDAISSFRGAAKAAGGSHGTKAARMLTAGRLGEVLYQQGLKVQGVDTISGRHIASYIAERKADGVGLRSMQNEMSHIRGLLRAAGRDGLANDPRLSNGALAIDGASRDGTRTAATDQQYAEALTAAASYSASVEAALQLERTLGLRSQEAIRSGASLASWERQLLATGAVKVIYGTKGGRDRTSIAPDREAALAAVRHAQTIAKSNNGYLFLGRLKEASTHYRNIMHRHVEIQGHSLRYSYAQDLVAQFREQGLSDREAFAKASISLGHGDGRGTYVKQVYSKGA